MTKMNGKFSSALGIAVVLAAAVPGRATYAGNACNLDTCTRTSVKVKTLSALTCTGVASSCDCNTVAIGLGYSSGSCISQSTCILPRYHDTGNSCLGGTECCAPASGRDEEAADASDSVLEQVSSAIAGDGDVHALQSFWGYYNSTLKSPSGGVASDCAAKIHVCFVHGFSDLSGVTDQNSCNNACNSATNTNQNECYDTDCSSRCGGWWSGTDSCT